MAFYGGNPNIPAAHSAVKAYNEHMAGLKNAQKMDLPIGAIIGGGAGFFIGGPAGAAAGASIGGQWDANQQNKASAQAQMDFQERMSNTSYRRGMADMRAAGLNPMLAYSQGGASTPSGAMATLDNIAKDVPSTALGAMQLKLNTEQVAAGVAKTKSDVLVNGTTMKLQEKQADAAAATAIDAKTRALKTMTEMPESNLKANASKALNNILDTMRSTGSTAVDAARTYSDPYSKQMPFGPSGDFFPRTKGPAINPRK